jgi:AGZA family xanthine/uracil permease-like MFS transporter
MFLQKVLGFDPATMKCRTEVVAGITTFLTMSYILAVNPTILASTGMDKGALFTSTAIVSAVATLLLAFMAKLPFAQAPSMGLNAFFAFTLVQAMGYSWQTALAAMFAEGIIFILITFFNIREMILNSLPTNLRHAISAGIGMFIAFIGLKNAGIIASNPATFVTLGKFSPSAILGIIAILASGILMAKHVKGALFYGIILCTLIGIPMGVTQIPQGFLPVSTPHSVAPIFMQFDFHHFFSLNMVMIIFTLLIINIFDTVGTLVGLANKTGIVKADGTIPHVKQAMMSDAIGTTVGSIFGISTITTYIESASGIAEGGRSGLTSFTTGMLFLIALLFSPIFLLIPSSATTGALVIVGVLMIDSVAKIDMSDFTEALPAFITIIMMILTYSIADGICLGILTYVIVKMCCGRFKDLSVMMYILAAFFIVMYAFK